MENESLAQEAASLYRVEAQTFAATHPHRPAMTATGGILLRDTVAALWRKGSIPLFEIVALETRTGCNLTCSFCPVSRRSDVRGFAEMPLSTVELVGAQLSELHFSGSLLLFCNNEPLLDPRLGDIVALCREYCGDARLKVLTNGTRLTRNQAVGLFQAGLTTLEIDNYTDGRMLIRSVRALLHARDLFKGCDVRVNVRRLNEVLTNRAGTAPNSRPLDTPSHQFCALPFTDLNVMPDGRVTLCCFDAYETSCIGSVHEDSLVDIWSGPKIGRARHALLNLDRSASPLCAACDYDGFRTPRAAQTANSAD
jgi:MoaA/NifB/PqqE/SkfB family radical SAM enzyme